MSKPKIIAIDGPAASGKSTVAEQLAKQLGYFCFDTGIMYRVVTLAALREFSSVDNEEDVSRLAEKIIIDVRPPSKKDGRHYDVILDGKDITWDIRNPEVERNVSLVSSYKRVRTAMTEQQRRIGNKGFTVMVGRDIGTVVFPEADLKIFMVASPEERAKRRYKEIIERGEKANYDEILSGMIARDKIDSSRVIAPLKPAKDAMTINTDGKSINEVIKMILPLVGNLGK